MKKSIFILTALAAFSFTSCKKDRVCTCVSSAPGSDPQVVTYTKAKKRDARANCLSASYTYGGATYTTTCTLK